MTMPKRGSRTIQVDGHEFRWRIRHKPTYSQMVFRGSLTIAIERTEPSSSCILLIDTETPRPDADMAPTDISVTPSMIADWIRQALQSGWIPDQVGSAFKLQVASRA